ncbi:SDR family NAD(P)-dependent oxidoreductase [Streptomyces canus]|uniref:SDR family NAD(P)-dependent oxidoreductase n=1 Tax=Streptomyces canus TaxID=58343 RepID=UPI00340C3A82
MQLQPPPWRTRALGGLDVLVNNAGVECFGPLHELTEDEFDRMYSVNLRGTWLVPRPPRRDHRGGRPRVRAPETRPLC